MRNIKNKQLRKLLRDKRFTSTVSSWGARTTTYNYRITNVKMAWDNGDPTTCPNTWGKTLINIVCSAYTTSHMMKKRTNKTHRLTDEQRIDKRFNPILRDCVGPHGEWYYSLRWGGNPREPRRQVRYALLNDEYNYGRNKRRASDLRNFLKHVGISGELKIGTIKLEPSPEL